MEIKNRFENKFTIDYDTGCCNWIASKDKSGYGNFNINGNIVKAHRAAWIIYIGEIPENMNVCHTCDNRSCVNVEHLFIGTQKDNMQDCKRKNRLGDHSGENNGRSKLTLVDIFKIKNNTDKSVYELSKVYSVHKNTIYNILRNENWNL